MPAAFGLIKGLGRSKVEGMNKCRIFLIFYLTVISLAPLTTMGFSTIGTPYPPGEIQAAARKGNLKKNKALIKYHPDLVFSRDNCGDTPLYWAATLGNKNIVKFLLSNKTEVNATNSIGNTPLISTAQSGNVDVAAVLLAHKADVNTGNPLLVAAAGGHKAFVKLLLANKAAINAKDGDGNTPLHWAVLWNHKKVVKLLLAQNAEINAKTGNVKSPLKETAILVGKSVVDVKTYEESWTPLRLAVVCGHKDIAELFKHLGGHE